MKHKQLLLKLLLCDVTYRSWNSNLSWPISSTNWDSRITRVLG